MTTLRQCGRTGHRSPQQAQQQHPQPSSRLKSGDPARLYWNKESFRLGEFLLIPVEREELCYSQMECGGNVKDVSQTMSRCESVSTAQSLSPLMHR